jgi:DNA adenine methylase
MKPFFCRIGSKRKYSKALVSLFPPHKTYVEAFFGGGAVFWEKEPSSVEVVNDLDTTLMADYSRVATAPSFSSAYPILTSETSQNKFLSETHRSKAARIVESLLRRCNGYGGNYIKKDSKRGVYTDDRPHRVFKVTTHESKLQSIGEYKARLSHATLLITTYASVFNKYDASDAFFFLDPPYEMSKGIGYAKGSESFDFDEFADALRDLEGKFLVTINDSPYIRQVFKGFNLYRYVVKGHHSETSGIGAKDRKELLITNYTLPRTWKSRMTKGVLEGGKFSTLTHREHVLDALGLDDEGHSIEELSEASGVPVSTLQDVYNRGIGAHKTQPSSVRMKGTFEKGVDAPMSQKLSKEQWAMARVYSFLDGNPKHDQDLRGGGSRSYLTEVKRRAKVSGYDPRKVSLASDGIHKIQYTTPSGRKVLFGREGYGDHILWSQREKEGLVPKGTASKKRNVFRKSHMAIKGKWKENPYSPNMLALSLLW